MSRYVDRIHELSDVAQAQGRELSDNEIAMVEPLASRAYGGESRLGDSGPSIDQLGRGAEPVSKGGG